MKKLIAGNWKMALNTSQAKELADEISSSLSEQSTLNNTASNMNVPNVDIMVFPSLPHIPMALGHGLIAGAQDCAPWELGAYTGDISAQTLAETGAQAVILGHSERRKHHRESAETLRRKLEQAHKHNLHVIYCIGETLEERDAGIAQTMVGHQLDDILNAVALAEKFSEENLTIAYEPVWAIGTGKSATPKDIAEIHLFIRNRLQERLATGAQIRILYGGSVKPENAGEIFKVPHVNGALIGGASLKAQDFLEIARLAS